MAAIIWNLGEQSAIDAWLTGRGSAANYGSPVTVPAGSGTVGSYGLGMGTRVGGVGSTKSDVLTSIIELGKTQPANTGSDGGYARAALSRDTSGWPAATLQTGSFQSTAPQQTFTFTGSPTVNGATLWFVAGSATNYNDNCLFGADTAAIRTFANGDTEKITPTFRMT